MYAVVSSGGKQYRVEPGSILSIERLDGDTGSSFTFERVLLVGDGDRVSVGTPLVAGASVAATILGADRGEKLVIFKFKPKVHYRRRTGHRQRMTRVRIDEIRTAEGTAKAERTAAPAAEAPAEARPKKDARPKAEAKPNAGARPKAEAKPKASRASAKKTKADAKADDKPKRSRASTTKGSAERGASARKPKRAQPEE